MGKKWPPLPATVHGLGGPITVVYGKPKSDKGEDCWGTWCSEVRRILIDTDCTPEYRWWVLGHEMAHAVLTDTGISELLPDESQETLCNAFGTARVMEMRGKMGLP